MCNIYIPIFKLRRHLLFLLLATLNTFLSFLAPPCIIIWQLMERHPTARAGTHGFSITDAFQK